MRLRIGIEEIEGVNEAQKRCGAAIILVLNVFFFIEEVFVGAFCLVITTVTTGATATSNWWVVGVERNFGRFYTLFVMNFRENDFWSQPSKNRCTTLWWGAEEFCKSPSYKVASLSLLHASEGYSLQKLRIPKPSLAAGLHSTPPLLS